MSTKPNKEAQPQGGKASLETLKAAEKKHGAAKAEGANKEKLAKAITDKKDLKYKYPEDCTTLSARKKFRTQTRRDLKGLEKKVKLAEKGKIEGVTAEQAAKELAKFKKAHLTEAE